MIWTATFSDGSSVHSDEDILCHIPGINKERNNLLFKGYDMKQTPKQRQYWEKNRETINKKVKEYCRQHKKARKEYRKELKVRKPLICTYRSMKQRCLNPKHNSYHLYGGRGIKVCQEWLDSYEQFEKDMGVRPEGCTLDRINNDGNYEPSNCKWSTYKEQANNRRAIQCPHCGKPVFQITPK